jgi:AcrR family transcriptional regulator
LRGAGLSVALKSQGAHRVPRGADKLSVRKSQKEATRQRVLDAARDLFETQGYEETTVREIARKAEVSVGSVFTTFSSKSDILSQVMTDRLDALYAELDRVTPSLRGSTADRLRSMFAIHFAFETRRTKLFLAHIAAAYDWRLGPATRPYGKTPRLRLIIRDCLTEGVARGDVAPDVDLDLIVDALMAIYAWTYRLAAWEGADAVAMSAVFDRQVGLIADGFRPRLAAVAVAS